MPNQKTEIKLLHKRSLLIVVLLLAVGVNMDYSSIPFHPERMSNTSIFFTLLAVFVIVRIVIPMLIAMPFAILIAYIKRRSERRPLTRSFDNILRNTRVRTFEPPPMTRLPSLPRRPSTPPVRESVERRTEDGYTVAQKLEDSATVEKVQEKPEKNPEIDWFDLMNDSK